MSISLLRLKKGEDRRLRAGHPWIYSNEIDTQITSLKNFEPGQEVLVQTANDQDLGIAYINPHSLISARLLSRDSKTKIDHDFFFNHFKQALLLREQIFSRPFYRLVFSEADNLPGLIIDRFENDFVVQINTAGMQAKQTLILDALKSLFPTLSSILLRNDSLIRLQEGLEIEVKPGFGSPPQEIQLEENSVLFYAPFWKGQKTSWFYDHRFNRARLKSYVYGKNVLDIFSYLGSFGIQAAVYGAKQVDCIEISKFACEYIEKNVLLNRLTQPINIICDDAFDATKKLLQAGKQYEVIILDPPAFVKKFKDRKEGLIAYQRINELALKLLVPNGILFSCSCSMHVSMEDLTEIVRRAAYKSHCQIQLLERGHQGPDHPIHFSIPESEYLKALIVRKI